MRDRTAVRDDEIASTSGRFSHCAGALVGHELRPAEGAVAKWATAAAIADFARELGDENPLWTDPAYAERSPPRYLMAPPSFVFECLSDTEMHWTGFLRETSSVQLRFHRSIRSGYKICARAYLDDLMDLAVPPDSGREFADTLRQEYTNQYDEPIATLVRHHVHYPCRQSPTVDSAPELGPQLSAGKIRSSDLLSKAVRRGPIPRFWQDVELGELTGEITRSLESVYRAKARLEDEVAIQPATPFIALGDNQSEYFDSESDSLTPAYAVRFKRFGSSPICELSRRELGVHGTAWQIQMLTDWMGDAGFLRSVTSHYRGVAGCFDAVRLGARVDGKEIDHDGNHTIKLTTWARLKTGEDVMPGTALIVLPSQY